MENLIEKQAELKERYLFEISIIWQNDKKMVDYCLKKNELYVPILNDTKIICLEKPKIEKEFYFPEHGHDFDEVCRYERDVNKNLENYFIEQNMKQISDQIKAINEQPENVYALQSYNKKNPNSIIYDYCIALGCINSTNEYIKLDEKSINNILEGLEYQKKTFEKRLKSYLKRYGTKKISTNTYWADR
jgi:hypothetical protein